MSTGARSEGMEYVRSCYGVPAVVGNPIIIDGRRGYISGSNGPYIDVEFGPGIVLPCHPTWRATYLNSDGFVLWPAVESESRLQQTARTAAKP